MAELLYDEVGEAQLKFVKLISPKPSLIRFGWMKHF
jgi:hypothetical protein